MSQILWSVSEWYFTLTIILHILCEDEKHVLAERSTGLWQNAAANTLTKWFDCCTNCGAYLIRDYVKLFQICTLNSCLNVFSSSSLPTIWNSKMPLWKGVRSSANIMMMMMDVDTIVYSKIRMDTIGPMCRGFVWGLTTSL